MDKINDIVECNRIIGNFMGKNFKDPLNYMYDNNWNELMPVVEKIEGLGKGYKFKICRKRVEIWIDRPDGEHNCGIPNPDILFTKKSETKIKSAWLAVIEFIQWFDNQNK